MSSFDFIPLKVSSSRELVPVPPNVLWRYESNADEVKLYAYRIISETSKGVWIDHWGKKKFVLHGDDGKRFGYRTKEAALISFKKRKSRQIKLLVGQLQNVEKVWQDLVGKSVSDVETLEGFRFMDVGRYYRDPIE